MRATIYADQRRRNARPHDAVRFHRSKDRRVPLAPQPADTRPSYSGALRAACCCRRRPPDSRAFVRRAAGRTRISGTSVHVSRRQCGFVDQAAPGHIARVLLDDRRQKLRAHGRTNAIRPHQQAHRPTGRHSRNGRARHPAKFSTPVSDAPRVIELVGELSFQNGVETAPRGEQLRHGEPTDLAAGGIKCNCAC